MTPPPRQQLIDQVKRLNGDLSQEWLSTLSVHELAELLAKTVEELE